MFCIFKVATFFFDDSFAQSWHSLDQHQWFFNNVERVLCCAAFFNFTPTHLKPAKFEIYIQIG